MIAFNYCIELIFLCKKEKKHLHWLVWHCEIHDGTTEKKNNKTIVLPPPPIIFQGRNPSNYESIGVAQRFPCIGYF